MIMNYQANFNLSTAQIPHVDTVERFKIMTYNIEESGVDPDWKEVVREENPDILVLVETGDWDDLTNDGFSSTHFTQLVDELNSFFPSEAPYTGYSAQNITYDNSGDAILSRFPVISFTQIDTVLLDDDTIFFPSHDFVDAEIEIDDKIMHVIGTHLKCCGGEDNEVKREKAQEGLNNYMDGLGDVPIIYAGDLNSFSPEDTGDLAPSGTLEYGVIPMLIDASHPNACNDHVFFDVFRTLNPSEPGFTYGWDNSFLKSRIDYIFANEFFTDSFVNSTVGDTPSAEISSDHLAVDAFFQLEQETTTTTPVTTTTSSDALSTSTSEISTDAQTTPVNLLITMIGVVIIMWYRRK